MADLHLAVVPPSRDIDDDARADLAAHLAREIEGEVRFGRHDRMLYSTDASIYQVEPLGVVLPGSVDDVRRIVRFAAAKNLALLPRGGGTSLAGQAVNHAIVIDLSKYCNRILEIDARAKTCRVEPGVVLEHLNRTAGAHGLMFGPDVATSAHATIGGMIGNNSSGSHSIRYGRTVEHLLGVTCLLADGTELDFNEGAAARDPQIRAITQRVADIVLPIREEIHARFPKIRRHVDGYNLDLMLEEIERSTPGTFDRVNLSHLMCGSEGTLAVMTEASLALVAKPQAVGLAIVAFDSLDDALAALVSILETNPYAVELLDDVVIEMGLRNRDCRRYVELLPRTAKGRASAVLYVEYTGDDQTEVARRFDELEQRTAPNPAKRYLTRREMAEAWTLRKSGEPLLHAVPGARKPITFIEDTAVDPARLASFVKDFRAIVARHGTRAAYYAHASVGCLHIRPLVDLRDPRDVEVMDAIATEVTDLVRHYGGALSGEHGDGRIRSHLLERYFGPAICTALREIKAIFDPDNRMNPGILIDPAPGGHREHWRVAPARQPLYVPEIDTYFRYEHGFGEAVEQCNGAGVCRKTTGGTMCPSYRGTRDERHATRGRGNALRLAITGQFGNDGGALPNWNDRETLATLDLCLSCKACKAECPSNVDIAKLKSEYLAQSYRVGGAGAKPSLATRLIADIRRVNRLGSRFRILANASASFAPMRAVTNRLLGFHPKRSMPRFEKSLFAQLPKQANTSRDKNRPAVILFADCFTTYNEPHIGLAAFRVLEALGYDVLVPDPGCCGRAAISVGMLDRASLMIARTARALTDLVERHNPRAILGLEPSCISAICDDWRDLKTSADPNSIDHLASLTFLAEDWIDRHWHDHPVRPEIEPAHDQNQSVLLHAHCHQKALWGAESSSRLLARLVPPDQLRILDSGCCGMAGSFGYARGHYDLSMLIGAQSLFAELRSAPDATIIAPGTSCRHQIREGTGRTALHPIEFAASCLRPPAPLASR